MDTCYLCVLGGQKLNSPVGRPATTDGFGTCGDCAVHACAVHGDKPINKNEFRCADCWSAQIGLAALQLRTPPPGTTPGGGGGASSAGTGGAGSRPQAGPDGDEAALAALISRFGPFVLTAIAPALGALAFQHVGGLRGNRMASSCEWLRTVLINRDRAALAALEERVSGDLDDEAIALKVLGCEPSAIPARQQIPASHIARMRLTIAFDLLLDGVLDNPSAPRLPEPGIVAGLAVLMAYAARGTNSINDGILAVPGALLLRPVILALGMAYWAEPAL